MSNKFCIDLNLNINPLDTNVSYKDLFRNPSDSKYEFAQQTAGIPITVLNPKLVSLLDNLNLYVRWIDTFYNNPHQTSRIHIDQVVGDFVKMNFVFGGAGSQMMWYKNDIIKPVEFNDKGTGYVPYSANEVTLLHSQSIGFPSIVQAGVPHNTKNFAEPRFCLSLFLAVKHLSDVVTVTIQQANELFSNLKIGAE